MTARKLIRLLKQVKPHSEVMLRGPDGEPWCLDNVWAPNQNNHADVILNTEPLLPSEKSLAKALN